MRKFIVLPAAFLAASLCTAAFQQAAAEPSVIDEVVSKLQSAETAANPTPILEEALEKMKKFNPKPGRDKMVLRGEGPKKQAGINAAAGHHKEEAVAAIEKAIATSKATPGGLAPSTTPRPLGSAMDNPGAGLKAEIDGAIGKVHMAGELKH